MLKPIALAALLLGIAGCARPAAEAPPPAPAAVVNGPAVGGVQKVRTADGVEGEVVGTPAPRSKFARVRIGMVQREVEDLIGQPNDVGGHITGKAFIPFYFGGDRTRIEAHYRGEGVLSYSERSFAGRANTLVRIEVDPRDSGYAR